MSSHHKYTRGESIKREALIIEKVWEVTLTERNCETAIPEGWYEVWKSVAHYQNVLQSEYGQEENHQ